MKQTSETIQRDPKRIQVIYKDLIEVEFNHEQALENTHMATKNDKPKFEIDSLPSTSTESLQSSDQGQVTPALTTPEEKTRLNHSEQHPAAEYSIEFKSIHPPEDESFENIKKHLSNCSHGDEIHENDIRIFEFGPPFELHPKIESPRNHDTYDINSKLSKYNKHDPGGVIMDHFIIHCRQKKQNFQL